MRLLVAEAGWRGLWRGALPNVQRAALVNMGEMTTYDTSKRWLITTFDMQVCQSNDWHSLASVIYKIGCHSLMPSIFK
ncbi:unnamed protein product [Protopolystoma xenopodis]|uniref:Uncharacterized protein n=1 Tax=Protopolystoma xenopodis TaxID=117903 RepID=A0A448X1F2_9PLAT|nr:unnamed protein product [Protopolystoma xenopodis]